jgi:hypothetical protein
MIVKLQMHTKIILMVAFLSFGAAQAQVPNEPTNLVVTPINTGGMIQFSEPSSIGGSTITNYEYSTDNGNNWITPSPVIKESPIIINSGLTNCTSYQVKLRAVNDFGNGIASADVILRPSVSNNTGMDWTSRTNPVDNSWNGIVYANGLFVAVGGSASGNGVMTSPDGINWTARTAPADNEWFGITYGNGLFVAVAISGAGNRVMTSPDGINWTARASAADNNWLSVTYGNGLFVAVAFSGVGNRVMTSPDGINWTIRTSPADNDWFGVTYGNGLFVAIGQTGFGNRVMTSTDGINWTVRISAVDLKWRSITYGNGLFVAVAYSRSTSSVMTSPDGINWTARTSAASNNWNGVTYGNGLFVAVASSGSANRVMISPDGFAWTTRISSADNYWNSVTFGNGLFMAVAASGTGNRVMASSFSPVADAPVITSATISGTTATVAFTQSLPAFAPAISNYEYSIDNGTNWTALLPTATASPITITGLASVPSSIMIRAVNSVGNSCPSNNYSGCTPTSSTETITACDSYTWTANSQLYTSSGTYTSVIGCDTKTLELTIKAKPEAPTAVAQTFCSSATVADLTATGTAVQWYDVATDGIALATTTAIASGTYYVSKTLDTCESTRTAVSVTITPQPVEPTKVNCWDNFVFNTGTCSWDNTGTQDAEPTKVNSWDTFVFNIGTCSWDNTGTQATEPNKVNCWDTFVFNTGTCAWDNTGTQAAEPAKVNCWDTFVFNTGTCSWDNTGTQATEPNKVNCWDTFVFNTGTCAWDNTGTQATEPNKVNCWDTFVFNTGTCAWDNTGTKPVEPTQVNTWDHFVFNTGTCAWGNTGTPSNTTKIQDSQCGVTLAALSTVIVPVAVPLAQGYKYKVTNTATNEVNYYTRSKTVNFALSHRPDAGSGSVAIKLSSTYSIAVAVKIKGVFSDYGTACLVSTPLLPTTKIQNALCGSTLANLNSYLYLQAGVTGNKGYRFRVTRGSDVRTYDAAGGSYYPFQLKQLLGGATYATTYEVAVSVFYNGAWQPYGATCSLTTPAAPQSKLASSQCGMTLNKTNSNVLAAYSVAVAQAYRFEVSKGASTYTIEKTSGSLRTFKLTEVPGLTLESGTSYGIRVAIKANGVWQPYGASCNVTTYGSPAVVKIADPTAKPETVFSAMAYPNPFSSAFQLKLNASSKAAVDLKVYDVLGRLIENRQWNAEQVSEQEMGSNYPSGVYNIILNQGKNVKTLRVIKR